MDLRSETITRAPQDTRSEAPRLVMLTARLVAALKGLPEASAPLRSSPIRRPDGPGKTSDGRSGAQRAKPSSTDSGSTTSAAASRRARKAGIPESVVVRMSGHRTGAVFGRYNVVDESDLRIAAWTLENHGRVWATVARCCE